MTDPAHTPALLADYADLTDPAARRRIEGDDFFVCEGPQALDRLIASGHHIRSVLLADTKADRVLAELTHTLDPTTPVLRVTRDEMRDICGFDLHRGVIAAANRHPARSLDDLVAHSVTRADERGTPARLVVAEGLNDPENLGAVARSARAFGIDALVVDPTCIDPYTRRTVRVSMGEILHLPHHRASAWPDTIGDLHAAGWETWALTPARNGEPADNIWTLPIPNRLALVIGAEGPGLTAATIAACTRAVQIPIAADVDSLNVAAAAAVAFAATAPRM